MNLTLSLLFLIVAIILFGLSAFNVSSPRVNLTAAGLLFLALALAFAGNAQLALTKVTNSNPLHETTPGIYNLPLVSSGNLASLSNPEG